MRKPPKSVCSPQVTVTERYFGISCVSDAGFVPKFDMLQMPAIRKLSTVLITHNFQHLLRSNVLGYGHTLTKLATNQAMPNRIALNQIMRSKTKACIAKLWEICALYDITECGVVIPHRHFGTTYWFQLQEPRNPKERTQQDRMEDD